MLSGGWIKKLALMLMACGFLIFGIQMLIAAYALENPLHFVVTFFSANLIILISAALLVGFGFLIAAGLRADRSGRADRSLQAPAPMRGESVEPPVLVDKRIENPADDGDQEASQKGGPEAGHLEPADDPGGHQQEHRVDDKSEKPKGEHGDRQGQQKQNGSQKDIEDPQDAGGK